MKKVIWFIWLFLFMQVGVAYSDITTGLVSFYPLNQNFLQSASKVSDIGSGSNHGTVNGNPVIGADSTAFATTDYFNCGSDSSLRITGDRTLTAWIELSVGTYPDAGTNWTLLFNESFNVDGFVWRIGGSNGKQYLRTNQAAVNTIQPSNTAIGNNTLRFIAVVISSGTLTFYLDGSPDGGGAITAQVASNQDFSIGAGAQSFVGSLSDVRIYSRALSSDDVAELYALGRDSMATPAPSGSVGYHATGLTSADSRCSFAAGDSWLAWDALDFSGYAGAGWFIRLVDSSGNYAEGYSGAVGSGETLGSELQTYWNMEAGDPPTGWTSLSGSTLSSVADERTGGAGSKSLNVVYGTGSTVAYSGHFGSTGMLIFGSVWMRNIDATSISVGMYAHESTFAPVTSTSWTNRTIYKIRADNGAYYARVTGSVGESSRFDDLSMKQITEPAATAIHILDGPSGSSGWAKVDSGFDYNDVVEISIIPNATMTGVTATGVSTQ